MRLRWPAAALALLAASPALSAQASRQPNAAVLRPLAASPARPALRYTLDLTHPANHLARVTLVMTASGPVTTLDMPDWYPGRYSIYNFAANVQQPAAFCQRGPRPAPADTPLPFTRTAPDAWQVRNGACRRVRWQYRVFGNTLSGTFSQLDLAHANINGGPVYMYPVGGKPDPVRLHILAPAGWQVLNALGRLNQARLWFPNYDIFIDATTEAAPHLRIERFHQDGRTYRVLIHDFDTPATDAAHRAALITALRRIVASENADIAPDDLDTYTFFFHFDHTADDGMEHLFGCQIMVPEGLATAAGLHDAEASAAHEFFHQWNMKRIRPAALGPFDYQAPDPTPSLWVGEGFTQYYGDLTMERTGLDPTATYLKMLGASMGDSLYQPNYKLTSAEEASITAWFHDNTPILQETNRSITVTSYYLRGEQLAAVLDLDLRARSGGRRSLNDVLRWLWNHTWRAPRATYYLPGRGYTDRDVEHAVEAVAGGASFARFFRDYVAGTRPIPYDRYLAAVGLRLRCHVPAGVNNYTGMQIQGDAIVGIEPASPADRAGFGRNETLLSLDGATLGPHAGARISALPPGRPATLSVREHGVTQSLPLTPLPPRASACTLADLPLVTARERALRQGWLGAPAPAAP